MRLLSLFTGIGGMDLGLERAGFGVVGMCEADAFCRGVLAHHWPGVPVWDDVRDVTGASVLERCGGGGPVDAVCGGFPCQDISTAGKGAGIEGERSGLWKEMHRVIREVGPRWVIAENVPALRARGADRVLDDLEAEGYACWPVVVGARHVGAPHKRDRVFVVAHRAGEGGRAVVLDEQRPAERCAGVADAAGQREQRRRVPARPGCGGAGAADAAGPGEQLADADGDRIREQSGRVGGARGPEAAEPGRHGSCFPPRPDDYARWRGVLGADLGLAPALPVERQIRGVADGLSERLGRRWRRQSLKALGNAVCPHVAEAVGRAVVAVDRELREAVAA